LVGVKERLGVQVESEGTLGGIEGDQDRGGEGDLGRERRDGADGSTNGIQRISSREINEGWEEGGLRTTS
jgi:hypothetical protein